VNAASAGAVPEAQFFADSLLRSAYVRRLYVSSNANFLSQNTLTVALSPVFVLVIDEKHGLGQLVVIG